MGLLASLLAACAPKERRRTIATAVDGADTLALVFSESSWFGNGYSSLQLVLDGTLVDVQGTTREPTGRESTQGLFKGYPADADDRRGLRIERIHAQDAGGWVVWADPATLSDARFTRLVQLLSAHQDDFAARWDAARQDRSLAAFAHGTVYRTFPITWVIRGDHRTLPARVYTRRRGTAVDELRITLEGDAFLLMRDPADAPGRGGSVGRVTGDTLAVHPDMIGEILGPDVAPSARDLRDFRDAAGRGVAARYRIVTRPGLASP